MVVPKPQNPIYSNYHNVVSWATSYETKHNNDNKVVPEPK